MNKVKINSLEIDNFRGISHAVISFNDKKTIIGLPNGGGKTTIKTAFNWVLGTTVSDYIPKQDNKEIEDLTTSVIIKLNVNDVDYTLKRISVGKYKLNNDGVRTKITNESKYYIDGIELIEKNYIAKVIDIFGADISDIKFLTELGYFTNDRTGFTRKERKKMLFDLCGVQQSIEDLIKKDEYNCINDLIVKGFTTAEIKSMIAKERRGYKEQADQKQILINNKLNEIAPLKDINFEELDKERKIKEDELNDLLTSNDNIERDNKITQIQTERAELDKKRSQLIMEDTKKQSMLSNDALLAYRECQAVANAIQTIDTDIDITKKQLSQLEEKSDNVGTVCPTCNQKLPKSRIDEVVNSINEKINNTKTNLEALEANRAEKLATYNTLKANYEQKKSASDSFKTNAKIALLEADIASLDKTLTDTIKSGSNGSLTAKKDQLVEEIKSLTSEIAKERVLIDGNEQVKKWKAECEDLLDNLRLTELKDLALVKFTREQTEVVESVINSKFGNGVTWVLFNNTYKNGDGGIEEECCPLYNGVRYESLSTGEKFICDLEIVKTLQTMFNCKLPLFIDNSEGISLKFKPDTQIIELFVIKEQPTSVLKPTIIKIKEEPNGQKIKSSK